VREHYIAADRFRIRYLEAGTGEPLIVLHGGNGLRVSRSHELLAEHHRVILFEIPGFGASPVNQRTKTLPELAGTMVEAVTALKIDRFNLLGNSFGAKLALWVAIEQPEQVAALVLAAPAAIRPAGPPIPPARMRALLYAHPERQPPVPPLDAATQAKHQALIDRLIGPARDSELEARMPGLNLPVLVVMGTEDKAIPPELGRHYVELLPQGRLVFVYDAAHAVDADRPEAFASLVADFLARKEEFLVSEKPALLNP